MARATSHPDAEPRYTSVAILLHWLIAACLLFNLATGLTFDYMSKGLSGALVPIHISSGISVLALTVIRILWRLTHRPPPLSPMAGWEKGLARLVHLLFYFGMLAAPLTGWAMVSAHPAKPVAATRGAPAPKPSGMRVWGVIPLPKLAPIVRIGDQPDGAARLQETHEAFEGYHGTIGWILLGLLILHVGGALKHQLIDRRRELARMGLGWMPAA